MTTFDMKTLYKAAKIVEHIGLQRPGIIFCPLFYTCCARFYTQYEKEQHVLKEHQTYVLHACKHPDCFFIFNQIASWKSHQYMYHLSSSDYYRLSQTRKYKK